MSNTKIEWTEKTWNPVTGCSKISEGCANCYAESMTRRFWAQWGCEAPPNHFKVQLHPDRLEEPLKWRKPSMVFVCSMSDLFHEDVPDEFIDRVFAVMALCPQHTFQILTKRPKRMKRYYTLNDYLDKDFRERRIGEAAFPLADNNGLDWDWSWRKYRTKNGKKRWPLPNVWLGVTAENQLLWNTRKQYLFDTPADIYFLSYEPALGSLVLSDDDLKKLDWVICGGETGAKARPVHPGWVRDIRDQCVAARVPFFFKSWGEYCRYVDRNPDVMVDPYTGNYPGLAFWDYKKYPKATGMSKVGKKVAGRLLDGREWSEYPIAAQTGKGE